MILSATFSFELDLGSDVIWALRSGVNAEGSFCQRNNQVFPKSRPLGFLGLIWVAVCYAFCCYLRHSRLVRIAAKQSLLSFASIPPCLQCCKETDRSWQGLTLFNIVVVARKLIDHNRDWPCSLLRRWEGN